MIISADLLQSIAPQIRHAENWALSIHEAASKYQIDTPTRIAMWLAQLAHETRGYTEFEENLNYTWMRLREVFSRYFPTDAIAKDYAKDPKRIANRVYAGRFGNGDEASGDGWRFRGRGLTHLTFRDNYRDGGEATGFDLVKHPDLAAKPEAASLIAGWYWHSRGCNQMADLDSYESITRAINGGMNGWAERLHWLRRTKRVLNIK